MSSVPSRDLSSTIACTAAAQRGAYGLRLTGIESPAALVAVPAERAWPEVRIGQRTSALPFQDSWCTTAAARLELGSGAHASIDRRQRSACLVSSAGNGDALLMHPFLSAVGATFAWWDGREALHGGAFVAGGGAWGLIGDKGAGKSSTLAALTALGLPVLSDDLIVLRGTSALAGPRCVDLDSATTEQLGLGDRAQDVGRLKLRLSLEPAPAEATLRGLVFLGWDRDEQLTRIPAAARLQRIASSRAIGGARASRTSLLELARLPAWELRRPHGSKSLDRSIQRLLALVDGVGQPGCVER